MKEVRVLDVNFIARSNGLKVGFRAGPIYGAWYKVPRMHPSTAYLSVVVSAV